MPFFVSLLTSPSPPHHHHSLLLHFFFLLLAKQSKTFIVVVGEAKQNKTMRHHRPQASRASGFKPLDRVSFSPLPPVSLSGGSFVDPASTDDEDMMLMQDFNNPSNAANHVPPSSSSSSRGNRLSSPYGFVPIPKDNVGGVEARGAPSPGATSAHQHRNRSTPSPAMTKSFSPYDCRMTTPDTLETASMTLDSPSVAAGRRSVTSPGFLIPSPAPLLNGSAHVFRPSTPLSSAHGGLRSPSPQSMYGSFRTPTPRPPTPQSMYGLRPQSRPKTPTNGRKSPFPNNNDEDDATTKKRIKTEMCMHYINDRPCPFGASCTYAHGEEELQMTKLLDLEKAGLVEVSSV